VPLILFDPKFKGHLKNGGTLADVAPTILGMLGVKAPAEMTGRDLRIETPR
jgi:2,3-bisphosphoglycerate-independent phosphoglycerate mutase